MHKHPISGKVKELTESEFLNLFDPQTHEAIKKLAKLPGTEAVVAFENLQMDSSQFGQRSALAMGPGCTYPMEEIERGARLGSTPSTFQYPTALWKIK